MKIKYGLTAMLLGAMGVLSGCGGGGSTPAASTPSLSGVAAVGFPIIGGAINVRCAAGSALAPVTTGSTGAWQIGISGQTLPCAVQVSGGTINGATNTTPYHSIATTAGTVNVTPLTDLMVANLAGTASPSTWFAGLTSAPAPLGAVSQSQVDGALTQLRTALPELTPLATLNPITTAFTSVPGTPADDMLAALTTAMANSGSITHASLLTNASAPTFTPPAGFGIALSNAFAGTSSGGASVIPSIPMGVSATASSSTQIALNWVNVSGATSYNIYRSTSANVQIVAGNKINAAPVQAGPYQNTGLIASTTYYYKVTAVNAAGESVASSEVSATTTAAGATVPAAPTGVAATATSSSQIILSWSAATGATGYNLYRSTSANVQIVAGNKINASPVAVAQFGDSRLAASTGYYYKVTAVNTAGESVGSVEVNATTSSAGATVPVAPTGVTVTAASSTQINLTWTAVADATSYNIYRGTAAGVVVGAASKINTTTVTTTSYNDTAGLTAATAYYYKVAAVNTAGEGAGSAEVSATTSAAGGGGVAPGTLLGGAIQGTALNIAANAGVVTTLAGSGLNGSTTDGSGTAASFPTLYGITTDGSNLYLAHHSSIRKIEIATGMVSTLAGGTWGAADGTGTAASFNAAQGITTDGTNLYVADTLNYKIRKVEIATGVVTTLAGSGSAVSTDGTGTMASFNAPRGITTDGTNLYVADTGGNKIRKIETATGVVTTLAGSGSAVSTDGTGTMASFKAPRGITTDGTNLYVVDTGSNKIRKIEIATGVVTTLAGSGMSIVADGIGAAASFNTPYDITTDGGNLYVSDYMGNKIRKIVIATRAVTTLAGSSSAGSAEGTGPAASFYYPYGITTDGSNLYVADTLNYKIRKIQ